MKKRALMMVGVLVLCGLGLAACGQRAALETPAGKVEDSSAY